MNRWRSLALLLVLVAMPASAGEPIIVLLADGTAWYSAGDGSPTVLIENIIHPPGKTPDKPGTPDKPTPPKTELRVKVSSWAKEVGDPTGAALLARAYQLLADEIGKGTIPADRDSIDEALTTITQKTIQFIGTASGAEKADEWRGVHQKVVENLATQLIAANQKLTADEYAEFFSQASAGLDDATAGAQQRPFLKKLLEVLLEILMEYLSGRFG